MTTSQHYPNQTTIKIKQTGPAFNDDWRSETARILRHAADDIEDGTLDATRDLLDHTGKIVGQVAQTYRKTQG